MMVKETFSIVADAAMKSLLPVGAFDGYARFLKPLNASIVIASQVTIVGRHGLVNGNRR